MAETCNGLLMGEFEAETVEELTPETAPPVPESGPHAPTSVQLATGRMAGQPNRLLRWALGLAAVFGGVVVSVAVRDFVSSLLLRFPILGLGVSALLIAFSCFAVMMVTKEAVTLRRLARLDWLHAWAAVALELQDLNMAQTACAKLLALYRRRSKAR